MSMKIDSRIPKEADMGSYQVKTPWEKLVSYHDAAHYCQRYNAVLGSAIMQAFRILVPDYIERSQAMCVNAYNRLSYVNQMPGVAAAQADKLNMHPFFRGNFMGGLIGDAGDEDMLLCGRVNDFGTYRVEKELDVCYWDVIGSELCRSTTQSLQACADEGAKLRPEGPKLEFHMVEAKGCGDRHCRIVAESREKYPMPEHEMWECFGPVGSEDQIKYTAEEDCVDESMMFRDDCDFTFSNGTNSEHGWEGAFPMCAMSHGYNYILPTLDDLVRDGRLESNEIDRVLHCVLEAAGKATFIDPCAKEGLRQYMGVPHSIGNDDGRLMGGYLEMFLQCMRADYEIEAFNGEECIYVIDPTQLNLQFNNRLIFSFKWFWYGMTKSLVSPRWSLWEEDSPENKLRIIIAKKIDKFC